MADKEKSKLREWSEFLIALAAVVLVAFLIRSFVIRPISVKGTSMKPTLQHGDIVFVNCLDKNYEFGEIIVCEHDKRAESELLIKRVIGLPGDEINIWYEGAYCVLEINGEIIDNEEYLEEPMQQSGDMDYPLTVPEDSYFVMGDNRNASSDSRNEAIGFIEKDDIIGSVTVRIWPISSFEFF